MPERISKIAGWAFDISLNVVSFGIVFLNMTMDAIDRLPDWVLVLLVLSVVLVNVGRFYDYIRRKKK